MKKHLKRTMSLLLSLVIFAGLLSGLTVSAGAVTIEERQQAAMAVALAYFDKGHSVQYDGKTLNRTIHRSDIGKTRSTNYSSPEYATKHDTLYTVCSDYAHQVYWEAFGYDLAGNAGTVWTRYLAREGKDFPECVWSFVKADGKDIKEEIKVMYALAQPGDIYTEYAKSGGHTMIWAGDITGDGRPDIIHSGGAHMNMTKQLDKIEYFSKEDKEYDPRYEASFGPTTKGGSIRISDAQDYINERYIKGNRQWMTLLRPAKVMNESDPIPAKTLYRVSHPRLFIERTIDDKTRFNSVMTGETVTMSLVLANNSTQNYSVSVKEPTPVGTTIKTPFEGAKVADGTMTLDVELKAGESKTLTAQFEITAALGEQVVFEGGFVGDIPSNVIPITVGGAKLNADDTAKLAKVAAGEYNQVLADAKANNETLGDTVYQNILGLKVRIPDFTTVATKFTKNVTTPKEKLTNVFLTKNDIAAEYMTEYRMMVQTLWGGFSMWTPRGLDRCPQPRDICLEPGDVIVRSQNILSAEIAEQMVYLGGGKYLTYDAKTNTYPIVEEPEFFRSIFYRIFFVLRPTQAYADVHALTEVPAARDHASSFAFTDVKEDKWYYNIIKDLADDNAIDGMTPTTFEPDTPVTFGQTLKFVYDSLGMAEPAKTGTHWASGYLAKAKELKWLDWMQGEVDLDKPITRMDMCHILAKSRALIDQPKTNPFTDTTEKDVLALVNYNLIHGMTPTTFVGDALVTRAQMAKIIWNIHGI
ncbi:MAG: S-layer homology domain-containing protein [Oscillospiraceae bacterium]|nr:S-layer homology domain-containing protein [Oscillospiraceae bacterium]